MKNVIKITSVLALVAFVGCKTESKQEEAEPKELTSGIFG